jgi:hypothetical protein
MVPAAFGGVGGIQSARSSSGQGPPNMASNIPTKKRVQLQSYGGSMVPPMQLLSAGDDKNIEENSLESGFGRQLSGTFHCRPQQN